MKIKVLEGGFIPKGYGIAYREQNTFIAVAYPIPLNLIIGLARKAWFGLRNGSWYRTGFDEGYSKGLELGRKVAFEQYKHHARKEIEEEVREEIAQQFGFAMEIFKHREEIKR